nr:glycoside hydrolase domain-containing protein [Microbacterium sp. JB110]
MDHGTWDGDAVEQGSDEASSPPRRSVLLLPRGHDAADEDGRLVRLDRRSRGEHGGGGSGWDFDDVRADGEGGGTRRSRRSGFSQGSDEDVETFYTSLYARCCTRTSSTTSDGRYIGFDGEIRSVEEGRTHYANFSDWDTYRTLTPLQTILFPDVASDMAQSLCARRRAVGLPRAGPSRTRRQAR